MSISSYFLGIFSPKPLLNKARKAHRWLLALVGVQVFVWAMTGAYMVFPNIHYIHGDHLVKPTTENLALENVSLSFTQVIARHPNAIDINLGWLGNRPVYRFKYIDEVSTRSVHAMLDANSGLGIRPLQLVDVIMLVPELINSANANDIEIDSVVLLDDTSIDYPSEIGKRGLPLWQVQLDTWDNTRLYVSQNTGELVYVRHHAWRLFDIFWRLHIMDYVEGDDIDNWLLAVTSVLSLVAFVAGLLMLYFRMLSVYMHKRNATSEQIPWSKKSTRAKIKEAHKWLALVVFVQLLLWVSSGFLLARMDHSVPSGGETIKRDSLSQPVYIELAEQLISLDSTLGTTKHIERVYLETLNDNWVYRLQHKKSRHDYLESDYTLVEATTGGTVVITADLATVLALATYNQQPNEAPPIALGANRYDESIPGVPKEENAAWLVSIDDEVNTKVVLNAQTGLLIAHINDKTPWRDLLFKLHFMDYANQGSFNNIFIKIFALLTLTLSMTGLYWLFELIKDKQFRMPSFSLQKIGLRSKARRKRTVSNAPNSRKHANVKKTSVVNSPGAIPRKVATKYNDKKKPQSRFTFDTLIDAISWNMSLSKKKNVYIKILYEVPKDNGKSESNYKIKVDAGLTVLEGLEKHRFPIQTQCAGSGLCAKCICQMGTQTRIKSADKQHLSKGQLAKNYRLACQHKMKEVQSIILRK